MKSGTIKSKQNVFCFLACLFLWWSGGQRESARWVGFVPFFKLPDFILSVQLLQLPKSMGLKKKIQRKIEPESFSITFKKVPLAEGTLAIENLCKLALALSFPPS